MSSPNFVEPVPATRSSVRVADCVSKALKTSTKNSIVIFWIVFTYCARRSNCPHAGFCTAPIAPGATQLSLMPPNANGTST